MSSIFLFLFTFLSLQSSFCHAEETDKTTDSKANFVKLSSRAYIHAVALIGPDLKQGLIPSDGAGFGLTLYDKNFADAELILESSQGFKVNTSLAYDSVEPYYYSGNSSGDGFQLREFYATIDNEIFGKKSQFWVGARKYQRIDEHHLMGFGVELPISRDWRINLTQGFRKDYPNWGTTDSSITASSNDVTTQFPKPLRSLSILDVTYQLSENSNWIGLVEYHQVGASSGSYPNPAYSQPQKDFEFKQVSGSTLATEINFWGARYNSSLALAYSKGDVSTSPLSKLNTQGSSTEIWDTTGTKKLTNNNDRRKSEKKVFTWTGAWNFEKTMGNYMLALSQDLFNNPSKKDLELAMLQARPYLKLENSSWQVGVDVSRTQLSNSYSLPSYSHIAPILRYSKSTDLYGRPFLAIWMGRSFYDRKYKAYDKDVFYADTYGLQFEATF